MHYDLFNYFPDVHYRKAIEESEQHNLRADGGGYSEIHSDNRTSKVYYWLDPDTGSALEHTGVNSEQTIPFFPDEQTAQEYLEQRAETGNSEQYECFSLYEARSKKVGDAVDVLTDQSGIEDFLTDGGSQ